MLIAKIRQNGGSSVVMKQKVFKPFMLQMIGLVITQCVMLTYNPLAVGWFGAMTTMSNYGMVALPIMIIGLYYSMGTLCAAKYGFVMLTILICSVMYKRKNGKVTYEFASVMSGSVLFIMEIADWFMDVDVSRLYGESVIYGHYYELFMIIMLAVVAGSGSSVFSMAVNGFMGHLVYQNTKDNYLSRQINQAILNNNQNILRLATGFKNLSYRIMDLPGIDGSDRSEFNIEKLSRQITSCVCSNCMNCGVCWGNKAEASKENVLEMMSIAGKEGQISRERLPTGLANQCINQKELIMGVNHIFERARLNFIWRSRMEESRQAVALQLGEMADLVEGFARTDYRPIRYSLEMEEYLKQRLREKKIIAKKVSIIENARGVVQIEILAKAKGRNPIPVSAAEKIFSVYLGQRIKIVGRERRRDMTPPRYINKEYSVLCFVEDANFRALYGVAKRTKEKEQISGDNYAVMDIGIGQSFLSICDGMGSGKTANHYSEIVVDLLEQMLKNGFAEDTSIRLINSVLMLGSQWDSPLAVDIGIMDLYSGTCNFVKMGAACTYIKRGNWVECLKAASLPMGTTDFVEAETITKKLYNGDFVIMVSDGIVEALDAEDKEAAMGRIIMDIDTVNPREMSDLILKKALEKSEEVPQDDMTVIAMGVWDKI